MRSKTSFFNPTVFWSDQRRYWPLTAGYALVWLLILPLTRFVESAHDGHLSTLNFRLDTLTMAVAGGCWSAFLSAVLFAMAAFSYLANPRATNGLHALPARRETLFATHYLAGLCAQLAPQALVVLLTSLVLAARSALDARIMGLMLLGLALPTIFFYSLGVLCMIFTGQLLAAPVFYAALNFLVVGLEYMVLEFAGNFLYGWAGNATPRLLVFSPFIKLLEVGVHAVEQRNGDRLFVEGLSWLWLYAAVGLVLAALSMLVYRTRRSEETGNTVAIGWAKPVFLYGVTFCAALAFGQLLYALFYGQYRSSGDYSLPIMLACMAAAGLLGYFCAEMLLKKSFRVWKTGWKGAVAVAGVLVALGVALSFDLTGYEGYVPDPKDVLAASVDWYTYNNDANFDVELRTPEAIRLATEAHYAVAADKERQLLSRGEDRYYDVEDTTPDYTAGSFFVRYTLTNGRVVKRRYSNFLVYADQLGVPGSPAAALTALGNNDEVQYAQMLMRGGWNSSNYRLIGGYLNCAVFAPDGSYRGENPRSLNTEEARRVYDAIVRDIAAGHTSFNLFGGYEERESIELHFLDLDATRADAPSTSAVDEFGNDYTFATYPAVTERMTETLAVLREFGVEIH